MEAISFPEQNATIAENQPEYLPLPAFIQGDPGGTMVFCFKLSPEEVEEISRTGVLWIRTMTFGQNLQPLLPSVRSPFES